MISDYSSPEPMELRLWQGDLLGVIQQKDPMGSEERWFVDNGSKCSLLTHTTVNICYIQCSPLNSGSVNS